MQNYRYLAAVTAVANAIEELPLTPRKPPYGVLADWMESKGIDAEDILLVSGAEVRAIVADLVEREQPCFPHAA